MPHPFHTDELRAAMSFAAVTCLAVGLAARGGDGSSSTAATQSTPSSAPATAPTTPSGSSGFTDLGRVLTATDFGQPSGTIIGDPTGVLLPDGRIRLFVFVDGQGVWRAISKDAEGAAFTVEGLAC